ncbi:uncharacterized protein B0H18DRAFT_1032707 [Fomitopsis serialis]|uniref:uncharacterized protein n=1 Tax=Fomitopsis serialis TaxID=139415 RepID=UPI002008E1A9|nr:uncharacterized protein B0H18DRAFT_1032707 [Neoantrodia serialis]KAH9918002.1 hypothetical protein B0H18DRAFT_1032707 [Neoantrodia serialis]
MLMSESIRSYGKRFIYLNIWEDPQKPFTHIWPMLIPASLLSLVEVGLRNCDWVVTRPHVLFFDFLSAYTSVTSLNIRQCRFRSIAELHRISKALPSLEDLFLMDVTLQHPLVPVSASRYGPSSRNKLKKVALRTDCSTSELGAHHQFLLIVCAMYSYVTELSLDLGSYSSFSHLHQFLCRFPHLSNLSLQNPFRSHVEPASAADVALYTAHAPNSSLSEFELLFVHASWQLQLLNLMLTPQACSQLEGLQLYSTHRDGPCTELVPRVTEILHLAGAGLKKFQWRCDLAHDSIHDIVPRITANTSLTNLIVYFDSVDPSLPRIQGYLGALLSDIQSPHLERLEIWITMSDSETSEDGDEASVSEIYPPGSTSTFHTILSRSVFDRLPALRASQQLYEAAVLVVLVGMNAQTATMSAIKPHMTTLFAPWLDRKVLWLDFQRF